VPQPGRTAAPPGQGRLGDFSWRDRLIAPHATDNLDRPQFISLSSSGLEGPPTTQAGMLGPWSTKHWRQPMARLLTAATYVTRTLSHCEPYNQVNQPPLTDEQCPSQDQLHAQGMRWLTEVMANCERSVKAGSLNWVLECESIIFSSFHPSITPSELAGLVMDSARWGLRADDWSDSVSNEWCHLCYIASALHYRDGTGRCTAPDCLDAMTR
jgi:hypothetical protein